MTDVECAEILADFRKLTLGPELSAAMDYAIHELRMLSLLPRQFVDKRAAATDRGSGGSIAGGAHDGVLMNSRAIDMAMA